MRPGRLFRFTVSIELALCLLLACLLTVPCTRYLSGVVLSCALSLLRNLAPLEKENVSPTITPPLPEAASPSAPSS